MRLIDIERLIKEYKTSNKDLTKVTYYDIRKYEVKAIPIDWIKKWCNEYNKSLEERLLKRYGVITMLDDWEKENENIRG